MLGVYNSNYNILWQSKYMDGTGAVNKRMIITNDGRDGIGITVPIHYRIGSI